MVDFAIEKPAYRQLRTSNELNKKGIFVSPGGVRSIWLRHDLETFQKRLKALEAKMAQENLILTEEQLRALEKVKDEKESHGEIESLHPGYLGVQDTYYVGTLKGVGRIYQQTFIDTYTKMAFVKLYERKNALVAADFLNDRVVPWCDEHDVRLLRILTDRGRNTAATGRPTNISSTWPLKISTTRKQRPGHPRPTASANASTRRYWMSFTPSLSGRKYTASWARYRKMRTSG